jgi:selenocysteine-specific elongation factor
VAIAQALRIQPEQAVGALERLVDAGRAVRVKPELYYSRARLDAACQRAVGLARERGELTLPGLRDALGTSRKYAQALLDHLDASKVTVRHGDRHVLRRPR